jgi:hypothetical protein
MTGIEVIEKGKSKARKYLDILQNHLQDIEDFLAEISNKIN